MQFKHKAPTKIQDSSHHHVEVKYGAKHQYVDNKEESPPLDKEMTKYVQAVAGTFLYYARAVEPTILPALSSLTAEQARPTMTTMETLKQLLDYCATQEEAIITFLAS